MKILLTTLLILNLLSAEAKDFNPKQDGQVALAAGRYTEAYQIWFASAVLGSDTEIQESVAVLLFSDRPIKARFNGERKVMALRLLFRSALAGRVSAMQRMAAGSANGWLGLAKNVASAACWSQAAAGARPQLECVGITRFKDENSRPKCDELVMMEEARHKNGHEDAMLCLANKTPAILIPMLPPTQRYVDALTKSYGRYGVEWMPASDAIGEGDLEYIEAFNVTMGEDIERRHGADVLEKISAELKAAMSR